MLISHPPTFYHMHKIVKSSIYTQIRVSHVDLKTKDIILSRKLYFTGETDCVCTTDILYSVDGIHTYININISD